MEIVINKCYGGFDLSKEAILRYAEIKDIKLFVEDTNVITHYFLCPVDEYKKLEEKSIGIKGNKKLNKLYFSTHNIKRDDPALVQTIKELGKLANGRFAELKVVKIPNKVEWLIEEYDGIEWIAEKHRVWS